MNVLPDEIPVVDPKLNQLKVLKRQLGSSERFSEADFDGLIVNQAASITSALKSAGILVDTELRFIARQVANIDVLFGEVAGEELVRLVFVEDKLFKNPESGRKVLAQILEYANKEISVEAVLAKAGPEVRTWLSSHRDVLEHLLERADFLLMICGDRINPRLLEIAKPMLDRRAPLRGVELVLLSLALYEGDGTSVVIPNLVGAVKSFERDLRIEVTVKTEGGRSLPAVVELEDRAAVGLRAVPSRRQNQPWTEARFLERVRANAKERGWGDGEQWAGSLLSILRRCEATPGLVVRWASSTNKNGYFNVEVEHPDGDVKIFWATDGRDFGVWTTAIAETLGVDLAGKRAEELAERLSVPLSGASNDDPYLGDDDRIPKFHDQKEHDILFDWITRMRDELLRVRSS